MAISSKKKNLMLAEVRREVEARKKEGGGEGGRKVGEREEGRWGRGRKDM